MARLASVGIALALLLLSLMPVDVLRAAEDESLRNWFDDPFFQVRNGVPRCAPPLGPFSDEAEIRNQSHSRSERGTRCWLAGQCRLPNSYLYDADIAIAVRQRFDTNNALRDASLWVTVQRRIVWIEGCVARSYRTGFLERVVRAVPDVELVVINVHRGGGAPLPYRTRDGTRSAPQPKP